MVYRNFRVYLTNMFYTGACKRIGKICALLAATLILTTVAYAGTDNGMGNGGKNNGKQSGHDPVPVVPEVNPVWVLVPFTGAVLLLSWRRFSRAKT
jgi:hypothetical protein